MRIEEKEEKFESKTSKGSSYVKYSRLNKDLNLSKNTN